MENMQDNVINWCEYLSQQMLYNIDNCCRIMIIMEVNSCCRPKSLG